MAIPKVFVSSTCYDLQEERAQLERFISGYGFTPVLSEYSGVYYDVDEHTHESCVNEVAHCDMFVLIISGRYGGKYKGGNGESITQAEYNKARELGLPVFTFVKADVSSAQHYYKENSRENTREFAEKINYPAIQKQGDAVSIFNFIESVHRASTNNGIETYQSFTDIEKHLKKQWAGLFFSFLQKRKEQDKVEEMTSILSKLAGSSSKLEALVGSLHDQEVGEQKTKELIHHSEIRQATYNFYKLLFKQIGPLCSSVYVSEENDEPDFNDEYLQMTLKEVDELTLTEPTEDWYSYLMKTDFFEITNFKNDEAIGITYRYSDCFVAFSSNQCEALKKYYETGVKKSTEGMRREVILELCAHHLILEDEL